MKGYRGGKVAVELPMRLEQLKESLMELRYISHINKLKKTHNCCSAWLGTRKWIAKISELSQLGTLVGGGVT